MIWYPYEQMKTMREPYKILDAEGGVVFLCAAGTQYGYADETGAVRLLAHRAHPGRDGSRSCLLYTSRCV